MTIKGARSCLLNSPSSFDSALSFPFTAFILALARLPRPTSGFLESTTFFDPLMNFLATCSSDDLCGGFLSYQMTNCETCSTQCTFDVFTYRERLGYVCDSDSDCDDSCDLDDSTDVTPETEAPVAPETPAPSAAPSPPPVEPFVWKQVGQDLEGEDWVNLFGGQPESLALSRNGRILAAGAAMYHGTAGQNSGQVRVFEFDGLVWNQKGQTLEGLVAGGQLGYALALSANGMTLVAGAPFSDDDDDLSNVGQVLVWEYEEWTEEWVRRGPPIVGQAENDLLGSSVALSADSSTVVVGVPGETTGQVRVLSLKNEDEWGDLIVAEKDLQRAQSLGNDVAVSGDGTIVASSGTFDSNDGTTSSRTRVLKFTGIAWKQVGQDLIMFGGPVAISEDGLTLAVGDPLSTNAGQVAVFKYNIFSNEWKQVGKTLSSSEESDGFGSSVALSSNGAVLAVGAPLNDGTTGRNAGSVGVYTYNASELEWEPIGDALVGEEAGDEFGSAVALSEDGVTVAGSARLNSGENGRYTGQVRVFGDPDVFGGSEEGSTE